MHKMQYGGRPNPRDYDDPYMYQQALDTWEMSQPSGINLDWVAPSMQESDISAPPSFTESGGPQYMNTIQEGIAKGIIEAPKNYEGTAADLYKFINTPPDKKKKNVYRGIQNIGIGMQAARTGLGWLSGIVERGRQNQFDMTQQTALGQMNPMPANDFQPNPYNLYMQQGGNLKTIMKEYEKFSNDAAMDMGDGMTDDKGMMQQGGRTPIYTSNVNDPRLKAYNDSLKTYQLADAVQRDYFNGKSGTPTPFSKKPQFSSANAFIEGAYGDYTINTGTNVGAELNRLAKRSKIKPYGQYVSPKGLGDQLPAYYKKPVQPVVYQKPAQAPVKKRQPTYQDSLILSKTKTYLPVKGTDAGYQKEIDDIIQSGRVYGSNLFDDPKVRAAAKRLSGTGNEYDIKPIWKKVGNRYEQTFKKPVGTPQPQKPIFKRPEPNPITPIEFNPSNVSSIVPLPNMQRAEWDASKPSNWTITSPTGPYNEQETINLPDESSWRAAMENYRGISSQQMDGKGTATGYKKMKKGGYEIDRMLIVRKLLPELLKLGRLGTGKYRNYKKGGIHINPENKGKFTDYCNGKVTEECIQRGLNSSNPTTRKRANFARNARKWNKEDGGMTYKKGGLTPNKAREILHDGTAQGKPLTDKQRRFFGAMSKGHTNYRGK